MADRHPAESTVARESEILQAGAEFACAQIKVVWSVLLRRLEIQPIPAAVRTDYRRFNNPPRRPVMLRYRMAERIRPAREVAACL